MRLFDKAINFLIKAKLDPSSQRREELDREAAEEWAKPSGNQKSIICDNKHHAIEWDNVVTFEQPDGLVLPKKCYKKQKNSRIPNMLVAHWDVCLSSKSCFNILKKRKLSVHFLIDNDGTIFQLMDCNDIGYHAGNRAVNNNSIGVEISNAYYPKYQSIYKKRGFGSRPVWKDAKVHGKTLEPFLGFYPAQEEAFIALSKALNNVYKIPLQTPQIDGVTSTTVVPDVKRGEFKGIVNHFHVTNRKIDCAGFDIDKFLKNI